MANCGFCYAETAIVVNFICKVPFAESQGGLHSNKVKAAKKYTFLFQKTRSTNSFPSTNRNFIPLWKHALKAQALTVSKLYLGQNHESEDSDL